VHRLPIRPRAAAAHVGPAGGFSSRERRAGGVPGLLPHVFGSAGVQNDGVARGANGKPPNNQPASGVPARGGDPSGVWPPFEPQNTVSLRHGARSDRFVEPLAAALIEALLANRPDLRAYPEAVAAWGTAEARCERLRWWHAKHGFVGGDGAVRNAHDVSMFESQAQRMRERLGLDPLADAALAKTRSEAALSIVDLESIRHGAGRRSRGGRRRPPLPTSRWLRMTGPDRARSWRRGLDYWGGGQMSLPECYESASVHEGPSELAAPPVQVEERVNPLEQVQRRLLAGESVAASDLRAARRAVGGE
jgi:hypothetical protein